MSVLGFPNGANATDTIIDGVHLNLTTLEFWNYTLYGNGTLSNGSWCMLMFEPYTPVYVFPNGSFTNSTSCYKPIKPLGPRGGISIGLAVVFGICLVLNLVNLAKHGKTYLPVEKRFWPIGRRWQWYWSCFVCAMALIGLIMNVDVDRYYLPEIPIVLTSFFWYLMQMGTMALTWEAVRHWGSWMERQFIDPNPFVLPQDDRRSKIEFWVPLFFYLFVWLNFFLVIPRSWGAIELQRSPEQTLTRAMPLATDSRFKAAPFLLFAAWLLIVFSLRHSIKHYCDRNRGLLNRTIGVIRFTPFRFILLVPLSLAVPAYQALVSWRFDLSPLNITGNNIAIFVGGYGPSLLIAIVQILFGLAAPNEDRELLRQRHARGEIMDRELGIVHKPAWWRRINGDGLPGERMRDRIARNVREIGGGQATARNIDRNVTARAAEAELESSRSVANPANDGDAVEMTAMRRADQKLGGATEVAPGDFQSARAVANKYSGKSDRRRSERTMAHAASLLFPNAEPGQVSASARRADLMADGPPPSYTTAQRGRPATSERPNTSERSTSTGTTNSISSPPQQIRSMLDV